MRRTKAKRPAKPRPQDVGFDAEWVYENLVKPNERVRGYKRSKAERLAWLDYTANKANPSLEAGDASGFLLVVGGHIRIGVTWRHRKLLSRKGMLESCIVLSYISANFDNRAWHGHIRRLLDLCDRDRLRLAGDPIPDGSPLVCYRGVSGPNRRRDSKGLSWSLSPQVAAWFACRDQPDPAVFVAEIPRDAVLFYTDERSEREIVARDVSPRLWSDDPSALGVLADQERESRKQTQGGNYATV
jgi:hypothetical protein